MVCENPWGDDTTGAEGLKFACQGGDRMDYWNGDHTVVRPRQQDLLRGAENRRLVRALLESWKARYEDRRGRKVLSFAAIIPPVLRKL